MRIFGSDENKVIECIDAQNSTYRVRWDYLENDVLNNEPSGLNYLESEFDHQPDIIEIKKLIFDWIDQKIVKKTITKTRGKTEKDAFDFEPYIKILEQ